MYKRKKLNGKNLMEHRYVYQQFINRPLWRGELIHHKNGDKSDNRIENLEIMTPKQHSIHHNQKYSITKKCLVCCKEFMPHPTKRARAKTCSRSCFKILQSIRFRNPNAPNSMYRNGAYPSQKENRVIVSQKYLRQLNMRMKV